MNKNVSISEVFNVLTPKWNISRIEAFTILSFSKDGSYVTFDSKSLVSKKCKRQIEEIIKPDYSIVWLKQIHGNRVIELPNSKQQIEADGSFTSQKGVVCSVITADCLPIVFSTYDGTMVGIVHAGRRGLASNIISSLVNKFMVKKEEILVWIGPGISQENYSVEPEIRQEFIELSPIYNTAFIKEENSGKYLMSLYKIAKIQLEVLEIEDENIFGAEFDTFSNPQFHSARRDLSNSGRMVTLIWIKDN